MTQQTKPLSAKRASIQKFPVLNLLLAQLAVIVITSGIFWVTKSAVVAYSVLLGGLTAIVPNAYFAFQAFRYSGAQQAHKTVRAFYRGEAGKFILTAIMFVGGFLLIKPLSVTAMLAAFIAVYIVNVFLAAILIRR